MYSLNIKTVPSQTIQFSKSTWLNSIWPIDRTQSGATTLNQSGPGSEGNKGIPHIPQNSNITGASLSDLVCYPGHSFGCLTPLQRYSQCILLPQVTGRSVLLGGIYYQSWQHWNHKTANKIATPLKWPSA